MALEVVDEQFRTQVTALFATLFFVAVVRLVIEIIYGSGFPIDQLIHFRFD